MILEGNLRRANGYLRNVYSVNSLQFPFVKYPRPAFHLLKFFPLHRSESPELIRQRYIGDYLRNVTLKRDQFKGVILRISKTEFWLIKGLSNPCVAMPIVPETF